MSDLLEVLLTDYRERQQEKRVYFQGYLTLAGLLLGGTGVAIAAAVQSGSSGILVPLPTLQVGMIGAIVAVNSSSASNSAHMGVLEQRINLHLKGHQALTWEKRYMLQTLPAQRSIATFSPFGVGYRILALTLIASAIVEMVVGSVWLEGNLGDSLAIKVICILLYGVHVIGLGTWLGLKILDLPDWASSLASDFAAEAKIDWPPAKEKPSSEVR